MRTIRGYTLKLKDDNGNKLAPNTAIVEFDADMIDDVPSDGILDGYTLFQGSIVYVISSGKFYVLDSEGKWHDSKDGAILSQE